ncbi:MAG: FixH family protein [Saprospiraceae bacterium]|nr:FixH family protein [Saprospiraceae bacterium]
MKLNWGKGIALVYGLFAASMLAFALNTTKYDVGLVKKDYYEDDINYQTHYVKMQNARALKTDLKVTLDSLGDFIVLSFPTDLPSPTGKILLFRPSQTGTDVDIDIKPDANSRVEVPTQSLKAGLWKIKVDWKAADKDYYKEQSLVIAH